MAHSSHIDPNGRNQDWRPPYDYSWVWLWFETTGDTFRQISRMFRLLPRVCHFDPALYQSGTDFCFLAPTILIEGVAQRPLVSNSTLGWPNQWWYQFWRIFFRWSVKTLRVILCQNYPAWLYLLLASGSKGRQIQYYTLAPKCSPWGQIKTEEALLFPYHNK